MSNLIIPESLDKTMEKALDKPAQNVGTTFGDLWYLVFGGISFAADKKRIKYQVALEEYEKLCRDKIKTIPAEKLVEPDTQTAAAALEASRFCIENKDVREMFSNLIASTMNSDTAEIAHPSFPEILKQMSSYDARLFRSFKGKDNCPIGEYQHIFRDKGYRTLQSYIFLENMYDDQADRTTIGKNAMSITLLERLGLIHVDFTKKLFDKSRYNRFFNTKLYSEYQCVIPDEDTIELKEGVVYLSDLGKQLMAVCCPDNIIHITASFPSTWETQSAEAQTTEKTNNT